MTASKNRNAVHFVQLSASRTGRGGKRIGAFINCWIRFPWPDGAELLAKHYVKRQGYAIRRIAKGPLISRRPIDKRVRPYFDEAMRDGASFVFHEYPIRKRSGR
jgi:hypothetical protein